MKEEASSAEEMPDKLVVLHVYEPSDWSCPWASPWVSSITVYQASDWFAFIEKHGSAPFAANPYSLWMVPNHIGGRDDE